MSDSLSIGLLRGGGLVLGYCCQSRCRHCLYGAGPHRRDGGEEQAGDLERILDNLAERAPQARYHIGGGEPFVDLDLLERAVVGMSARGLRLEYVETNAAWAKDSEQVRTVLERMALAGLGCLLISASPFHAEHIPLRRTLMVMEAADKLLPDGAFIWIPEFLQELAVALPDGGKLDLERRLMDHQSAQELVARYGLVPRGRTARLLFDYGPQMPWQQAASERSCAGTLSDTSHFHVDLEGRYVPGLCAGLVLPIEAVPGEVKLRHYPVLEALVRRGVAGLVELARVHGFAPAARYSGPCDLCGHARAYLAALGGFEELGPSGYYDERSVSYN